MRNIAGHPQAALNAILALDVALRIDEIVVLHHTGMSFVSGFHALGSIDQQGIGRLWLDLLDE